MDFGTVFSTIEGESDRMAGLLCDLIRIDTAVPPGSTYPEFVSFVEPMFRDLGMKTERVVVPEERWRRLPMPLEGERVNLVARYDNGKPPVSIYAHMDVVPPGDGWSCDPFGGVIRDGKVVGRGAVDDKGPIAPLVVALEVIARMGLDLKYDPVVLLCTDEEVGYDPGSVYLAERGYFVPPVLHLDNGGQCRYIGIANAGSYDATLVVEGRQVHAGFGFLGVNALEESVPIMAELRALKGEVEKRTSDIDLVPLPGVPARKLGPTFNMTVMRSGEGTNVVPSRAEIRMDRRSLPEESDEDVRREIVEAVGRGKRHSGALSVDLDISMTYPPHEVDTESPHLQRWMDGMRMVLGLPGDEPPGFVGIAGATDMSFVAREIGSKEFISAGVADLDDIGAHQPDESVPVVNLVRLCQEIVYFLTA